MNKRAPIPTQCWLVEGENESDDLADWKAAHPDFVTWDSEWFEREFVKTGQFIDSDSDSYCGGGSLLLFRTRAAAEHYVTRDAAIASELRTIEPAIFVRVDEPSDDAFPDEAAFDAANDKFRDIFWSGNGLAAFHGKAGSYLVFPNSDTGRNEIHAAIAALQTIPTVTIK